MHRKRITIIALDKDSGASYSNTFVVSEHLKNDVKTLFHPPFSRYFTEAEVTDGPEKLSAKESKWIENADVIEMIDLN